jgi:hypothetical protein
MPAGRNAGAAFAAPAFPVDCQQLLPAWLFTKAVQIQ